MMLRRFATMWLLVLATALVALGGAAPALAQAPAGSTPADKPAAADDGPTPESQLELTRAVIQVQRQAIVTQAMDLEPSESDAFWPLYRSYRMEMMKIGDRMVKLIDSYMDNYESMTDDTANRILDEYLKIERARLDVKTKYVPRFRKILPSRKVARFFQVENKLDAVLLAELAENIPVVK